MKRNIFPSLLILGLLLPVSAESFSTTNLQLLYGANFRNMIDGSTTNSGVTTITAEDFRTWKLGDNFMWFDYQLGNFTNSAGLQKSYLLYGEIAPRLSLSKIFQTDLSFLFVKDVLLAGMYERGDNFHGLLFGMGLALNIPQFEFFDFNLYQRDDNYNDTQYQVTLDWRASIPVGCVSLVFEGYTDITRDSVAAQPRLLIKGKEIGLSEHLEMGVEYYYFHNYLSRKTGSLPQFMVKWIF